jgi:hypothetical protein
MAIQSDQNARADDFINSSEKDVTPANDNGRVVKLEQVAGEDAKISNKFISNPLPWQDDVAYVKYDEVSFNKEIYVANVSSTGNEPEDIASVYEEDNINTFKQTAPSSNARDFGRFANDGLYYYSCTDGSSTLYRKTLATAYEIDTETAEVSYTMPISIGGGFAIKNDGTRIIFINANGSANNDQLWQVTTATPYDFTSITSIGGSGYDISSNDNNIGDMDMTPDGFYIIIADQGSDRIKYKEFTTAWDITSQTGAVYGTDFITDTAITRRVTVFDDGNKVLTGTNNSDIYELTTQNDPSSGSTKIQTKELTGDYTITNNWERLYRLTNASQAQFERVSINIWSKKSSMGEFFDTLPPSGTIPDNGFIIVTGAGGSVSVTNSINTFSYYLDTVASTIATIPVLKGDTYSLSSTNLNITFRRLY